MSSCTFRGDPTSAVADQVAAAAAAEAGVPFADVAPLSCTVRGRCPLVVGRTVVYQDDDHLTMTWVRRVAGAIGRRLDLPAAP
jgi:hypothetical protein